MVKRIYSLDIVRGIAAVSVFLTHLGNSAQDDSFIHLIVGFLLAAQDYLLWCNGGLHWAVIVFIVLSGFCIHMASVKNGPRVIVLRSYARRRFLRIYPVFLAAILLGYLGHDLTNQSDFIHYIINLAVNLLLFTGIIPNLDAPYGNEILGTVVVECVLYAIYPFILPSSKRAWVRLLIFSFIIYLINFGSLLYFRIDPSWVQRNIFSFLIYWWLGAFAAENVFNKNNHLYSRAQLEKNVFIKIAILYAIYIVLANYIQFKGSHVFKSLYLAILTAVFLFGMVSFEYKKEAHIISRKLLFFVGFGEASYSLYVIHLPIISLVTYFMADFTGLSPTFLYILKIIFVIMATLIFFKFIEKPSHRMALDN